MEGSLPVIKVGFLKHWNPVKNYGFVEVPGDRFPLEMYFLHAREIVDGQNPPPKRALVRFEVGQQRTGGRYPVATQAMIVDPKSLGGAQ
jgi:hypothetical protein